MRKPTFEEFNLTEEMLMQNKKEYAQLESEIERSILRKKKIKKVTLVVSIAVTLMSGLIFCISNFKFAFAFYTFLSSIMWDMGFVIYYFQTKNDTLSYSEEFDIKEKIVNNEIDENVKKYNLAVQKYKDMLTGVNEHSIVKVKLFSSLDDAIQLGEFWLVFSNVHLANARSFPDISIPNKPNDEFEKYYYEVINHQRNNKIEPKFKKKLGLEGKVKFYYPCSDLFMAMKDKKIGDIVYVQFGKYQIISIDNSYIENNNARIL